MLGKVLDAEHDVGIAPGCGDERACEVATPPVEQPICRDGMELLVAGVEDRVDPGTNRTVLAVLDDVGVEPWPPKGEKEQVLCAPLAEMAGVGMCLGDDGLPVRRGGYNARGAVRHDAEKGGALHPKQGHLAGDALAVLGAAGRGVASCGEEMHGALVLPNVRCGWRVGSLSDLVSCKREVWCGGIGRGTEPNLI